MTIDDNITNLWDYNILSNTPPFDKDIEKELQKDRKWKNNVAIEHLIVDDKLKEDIVRFCKRKDIQNPNYWIEKNHVMREYKNQCAEHLMNEYGWPKWIAKSIAATVRIPRNKTSISDYIAAYFVGSLPNRYVEPVAKLMGADRKFYTNINIVADAVWLGISAYVLFGVGDNSPAFLQNTHDFMTQGIVGVTTYANAIARVIQIPIRAFYNNVKGVHTWSPATLINPNPLEVLPFVIPLGHHYITKIKEHKKNRLLKDNSGAQKNNFLNHS